MTDGVKFCTLGTLVKKVSDDFYSFLLYVEVQIGQIKMMQSFIGLAGLIFEINGKNWQFITFLLPKPHKDVVMLHFVENAAHYMNLFLDVYELSS